MNGAEIKKSKKKDQLKVELARRLSKQRGRHIRPSDILDRDEAAELAERHPNTFTNGVYVAPDHYVADKSRFGPKGLRLYLREDVLARHNWGSNDLGWPSESYEPTTEEKKAEIFKLWGGLTPDQN